MADQYERLVTVWDANFQKLDEKLDKINRKHHVVAGRIKKDADNLTARLESRYGAAGAALGNIFSDSRLAAMNAGSSRLSVFGSALAPLGAAGLAAAAGVAALAVATQQTIAAMAFADEIDDAAQKLNIGTEALQEYRFAMTEVGGTAADADAAIGSFTQTLGAAQSGLSPRAMKGFAALGFTKADLDAFDSGEEALAEVARRVSELSKESERAAVAEKLGLGAMLPLLREGADEMENLRQKAQDMGYVMDAELVAKGADANQQFETMARIIDVQMKSAFIGLSDEVLAFTSAIADALKALNGFLERANEGKSMRGFMFPGLGEAVSNGDGLGAMGILGRGFITGDAERRRRSWNAGARNFDAAGIAELMAPDPTASGGGARLTQSPPRGGGRRAARSGPSPEDLAAQRTMLDLQARLELLKAEGRTAEARSVEQQIAALRLTETYERAGFENARAMAEQQVRRVDEAEQYAAFMEAAAASAEHEMEGRQRAAATLLGFTEDLLNAQLGITASDEDALAIRRELLILRQHERRMALETAAIEARATQAERDAAAAILARLPQIEQAERGELNGSSRGARNAADIIGANRDRDGGLERDRAAGHGYVDQQAEDGLISAQAAADARLEIDQEYWRQRLAGEGSMLDAIAGLQGSSIKELAALGKAAAIAQATIDGYLAIQKAWASAPFPANLPAVAITTAMTASNIAAIAGTGFEQGGYTGNGGTKNVAGVVHGKEFVFDAPATRRIGVGALEALRSGSSLISGLSAASPAGAGMRGGSQSLTFAPTVHAPGADMAAVRRIEQVLDEQNRTFAKRVNAAREQRHRFQIGKAA